ncbi:MAG: Maf family protein [Acidiphilium sp.]|nr:Maf family protein [Acidiphilium sp.]MDD4934947.1 Maf family protein [Acidiphilium sp.]
MLRCAGVAVEVIVAEVDEARIKADARHNGACASDLSVTLAVLKAAHISAQRPEALVIGADQVLHCNDVWFDKPTNRDEIRTHIRRLRGQTHYLATAVACARAGTTIWHHTETAELTMRMVSDAFIEDYIAHEGNIPLASVGAYLLESRGIQLFNRIEGSYFTILGLPLLPLLGFLRQEGVLLS